MQGNGKVVIGRNNVLERNGDWERFDGEIITGGRTYGGGEAEESYNSTMEPKCSTFGLVLTVSVRRWVSTRCSGVCWEGSCVGGWSDHVRLRYWSYHGHLLVAVVEHFHVVVDVVFVVVAARTLHCTQQRQHHYC